MPIEKIRRFFIKLIERDNILDDSSNFLDGHFWTIFLHEFM